jgi:adenylate kinase
VKDSKRRSIVMLGPPASGKGTQAQRLAGLLGARSVSTGSLLREAIARRSPEAAEVERYMQSGELVPDRVMIELVRKVAAELEGSRPLILDGFPRTLAQAVALDRFHAPGQVVLMELDDDEVIRRISGRRIGPAGEPYHLLFNPPPPGTPVTQRPDDSESVVRERLEVYRREAQPLIDYYEPRGLLVRIPAGGTIDEVFSRLVSALALPHAVAPSGTLRA